MVQTKYFMFGIDSLSFIDDAYNVYSVDDPQKCTIDMQAEVTEHRGGKNNDIRATAMHSRSAKVSIGTGYVDQELAEILTGGTITSLGTSAASIITGTACGVNTLYGTTATIYTGISTVTINSPTLVKTSDYYIKATGNAEITVTRVEDGKQFSAVTLTNSAASFAIDSDRGIVCSTTAAATSLTINEKAYISVRSAINTINRSIKVDGNKPGKVTLRASVDYNGYRRVMNIPIVQPKGQVFGNGATEFQVQDLEFTIENSTALDELCDISIQG